MKKSKLLILLPLIVLTMSSCDMSLVAGQSGSNNRSSSSEEVNEPSSYSSYLVEYGLYYEGNLESLPEGASLYLYGSLVRDSFTPLTVNEEGYYQTTIYDIEYGTYDYSLYIEYTDKDVSLESPLVYSGLQTVNGNSSSGGDKNIYLESSLSELLGEEQDEGLGEDITYTYTIEVDNTEALTTLTYDGNSQTQTSVDLQVYLVTTGSDGNSSREEANADDVSISTTGYDVISISGLTVTVVGAGNTTLTISATDYTSTSIDVIVTDVTDPGTGGGSGNPGEEQTTTINNYTIIFTLYDSNNDVQTCPDNGSLYIQSNFGGEWVDDGDGYYSWGSWEPLTESKVSDNTTYSITASNLVPGGYYECNIIFVPTGDSASDDWANLVQADGQNIGVTISSDATDGGSQNVDVTGCYNLEQQYGSLSGTTDGGKPDATYIHNFTLVVTIYGSDGTTVKKAPSGYDLYIAGDMDGKWTVETTGSWYTWGDYVQLVESTDSDGNVTYSYTFNYVEVNTQPTFNIVYATNYEGIDWNNRLNTDGNYSFAVAADAQDGCTITTSCSIASTLDSIFPDVFTSSGDQGQGGDQGGDTGGNQGSLNSDGTATVTLNIIMYASDGTTSLSVPEGCKVYIAGSFDISSEGDWWNLDSNSAITLASSDNNTYLYTYTTNVTPGSTYEFKLLLVEDSAEYDWYNYTIYDSTFTVPSSTYNGDSIDLKCTTEYTDLNDALTSEEGEDEGLKPDATYVSNYTLQVTIKDGSGHIKKCASGYSLWMQSALNGYWDSSDSGWWDWGDYVKLTENVTDDSVTYTYTYDSVVVGESYEYNILYSNATDSSGLNWDNDVLASSNFSFTVDSNATDNYTQSITCTATSSVVDSMVDAFDYSGESTYEGAVTIYFLIIDTTSATNVSTLNSIYVKETSIDAAGAGPFPTNGDSSNWYNWSSCTKTSATVNGQTHVAAYNSVVGAASTGDTLQMSFYGDNNNQSYYFTCYVPTNCGDTLTCVVYQNITAFEAWKTDGVAENPFSTQISDVYYYAGTPTTVLASL